MTICPTCGNELEPGTRVCPHCGAEQPAAGFMARLQGMVGEILATAKTHPRYWMAGGGVVLVGAIAAVVVFGGLLGPSGKQICTATLQQAKDFGVISPSAELSSTSAKSTDVDDRKSCTAAVGNDIFTLLADVKKEDAENKKCKDWVKQSGCVKLYSVARSDGLTSYQVREIPPDETDEALAAENPAAPAPNADNASAVPDQSGLDSETAVDTSGGGMQSLPSQPPADQGEPQPSEPQQ